MSSKSEKAFLLVVLLEQLARVVINNYTSRTCYPVFAAAFNHLQTMTRNVLVKVRCEYIGSLAVPFLKGVQRENYIHDKLMGMENVQFGLKVALIITTHGIKTCRNHSIKLGHSICHVLFSSCLPQRFLFAYITRSYSLDRVIECQAHVYKISKSKHYHSLKTALEKAFELCGVRKKAADCPIKEYNFLMNAPNSKLWSKCELVIGHDALDHVKRINNNNMVHDKKLKDTEESLISKHMSDPFDLGEYVIIDGQFIIENEFYIAESLLKRKPVHCENKLNIINEYYTHTGEKLDVRDSQDSWLLSKGTPATKVEALLKGKFIGSYYVVPHATRDESYILHLRVPAHIHNSGILSCTIKETASGFHLQGCRPYFESLTELVEYYGSVHCPSQNGDQVDHGMALDGMLNGVLVDYECFESTVLLMSELKAFKESVWQ